MARLRPHMPPSRSRGFTLIEVLVAITILMILIAILMPMIYNVHRLTKETVCAADTHQLTIAALNYALDTGGVLPDLSKRRSDGRDSTNIYWSWPDWRRYMENNYGLSRIHWYSPSNPKWSLDRFYYWGWNGVDERTSTHWVMGRYYMASSQANSSAFYNKLFDPPADRTRPMFPRYMDNRRNAHNRMIWMDLTRQWPAGSTNNWVTPGDPNRWGANHLYAPDHKNPNLLWPSGAHVGYVDGAVLWTPGHAIKHRLTWKGSGVDIYW